MKALNINSKPKIISLVLSFVFIIFSLCPITAYAEESETESQAIDVMLQKSQQWLNNNYSEFTGFELIPEDGISRRSTLNGCIKALQVELGITELSTNFGNLTTSNFNSQYPNGVVQQEYPSEETNNIYGIIQCALWIKGYTVAANDITTHFYDGTGNAIKLMKSDMGFVNPNSTVTIDVMKGLLSMDQYVCLSGGSSSIRSVQQALNREYSEYVGIIPCNGIYDRKTNIALIKALQAIEGYSVEAATGNFGSGTKANLPILPDVSDVLTTETEEKAIVLLKYALCCNGYDIGFVASFDSGLYDALCSFQEDMMLTVTGKADVDTWMSLLTSTGNPDRAAIACDTRFEMTQERIDYLKANGYQIVGRYLTGSEKGLKVDEPKRILDNGLYFFPIFQETLYTDTVAKYNYNLGVSDTEKAVYNAKILGIPYDNIIYYAIDFDPTDYEIETYVLPYFKAISETTTKYKIGVYGTRNVCTQVMNAGYAETCFVSDLSTGYSGNMGFRIPQNWNLDQFNEYTVTTASGSWDIDKVAYSGNFPVVTSIHKVIPENSSDYLYGSVTFDDENVGNWFVLRGDKFRYRVVWNCPDGNDEFHYLNTYLQKYHIGTVWTEDCHYGEFEYQTDWMPVEDGAIYRLTYKAHNLLYDVAIPANVTIYFDTAYDE